MEYNEPEEQDEDVYSNYLEELMDNDELSSSEAGFMSGYNES